jgi:polysaccharide biosynthesis/export protein
LQIRYAIGWIGLALGQWLFAQEPVRTPDYFLGKEEKLEMDVHIWGEVRLPGEYRVDYSTNLVELISKAGGPTQFANLKKVRLARVVTASAADSLKAHRIVEYNLESYLKERKNLDKVPVLLPGDVVVVVQNRWFQWRELVKVAHEVAVIASVYVWYLRAK